MTSYKNQSCESCRFSVFDAESLPNSYSPCRRFPPYEVEEASLGRKFDYVWVQGHDWCGEWAPRERQAASKDEEE